MGPITDLLSVLSALINVLLSVHLRRGKNSLNDLKCGTFTGRFPIDGATSMAEKGLRVLHQVCFGNGDDNEKVCLRCSARSCTCGARMKRTDYLSGLDAFKVIAVTGSGGRGRQIIL